MYALDVMGGRYAIEALLTPDGLPKQTDIINSCHNDSCLNSEHPAIPLKRF